MPKTRADFWQTKFDANVERDARAIESLERLGWRVAIIWECEVKTPQTAMDRVSLIFPS